MFEKGIFSRGHLKVSTFNNVKTGGGNIYSNPTPNFCYKVITFTTVCDMYSFEELLSSHMEKVDSILRTWHYDTFCIIKDEGHGSLDSNIFEGN